MPTKVDKVPMPRAMDRRVKITDEQRRSMRRMYNAGWTQQEIADYFGVSRSSVCYIVSPKASVNLREYRREHPAKSRTTEEMRVYKNNLRERKREIAFCVNAACPFTDCQYHASGVEKAKDNGVKAVSMVGMDATCRRYISHLVDTLDQP